MKTLVAARLFVTLVLLVLAPQPCRSLLADEPLPAPLATIELNDGEHVVFLGDSITHQCLYTQYVEDYFFTRYPKTRLHFYNSGVSGDRAADALARFDGDVAAQKPAYVTVLLGMNDGLYRHFDHEVFKRYETDMSQLIRRLHELDTKIILMGPSMYDARVSRTKPPRWVARNPEQGKEVTSYYPAVLAFFGAWLRDQATHQGLGYVELQAPMEMLTRQARVNDPSFTMIPDAVHPDPNGHAVMAHQLLEQMRAKRSVSSVTARCVNDKWRVSAAGGTIDHVEGNTQQLSFTFAAESLPWVLPQEAQKGFAMAKSGHKLSNERLRVVGLAPGKYELAIDGEVVGTYTDSALAGHIELQSNAKTPQYQQALRVAVLNRERNEKAIRPLRNRWADLRNRFTRPGKLGTPEHAAYMKEFVPDTKRLAQLAADYEARIYQLNQPEPRRYTLKRIQ